MKARVLRTLFFCCAAALTLTLATSVLTFGARAADIVDSGACGDNLTWTLDSDGVLTISGAGAMYDYGWERSRIPPWYENRNKVTALALSGKITALGNYAFYHCEAFPGVTIPDSVTSIGDYAFSDCGRLTNVTIPDSVTSIGEGAFTSCYALISVTIPDSVISIGDWLFTNCFDLKSATIGKGVTAIGDYMFASCGSLTSVTIPDSVTAIGGLAFGNCKSLTDITIPDSVTSIGVSAFGNCKSLTDITIPDSVTYVGREAFKDCENLMSVTIGKRVTAVAEEVFHDCIRLTSVTIPASVTSVGERAFDSCDSLTDVYYGGSATQWSEICIRSYGNGALNGATVHFNEKDVGVGITLTDENGKTVDANGQTGETEATKQDAFQAGDELTANFEAVDPDASSGLVSASVFIIFYDKNGLMSDLTQKEIDLSEPLNLLFILNIRIPEGAKTLKILMLGDGFEPLRAVRLIDSPDAA